MLDCIYKGTAQFPYIRYRRELLLYYLGEWVFADTSKSDICLLYTSDAPTIRLV